MVSAVHRSASYVFGTLAQVTLLAEPREAQAAAQALLAEFDRLHWKLHAWKPGELDALNRAIAAGETPVALDAELARVLRGARELSERSGGLFDPAIGRAVGLWNFHDDTVQGEPPPRAALEPLLAARPRMTDLAIDGGRLVCANRMVQLDLGGYAKGYALDRARELLAGRPVAGALIDLGGHVMALGRCGDRPWAVGLRRPRGAGLLARIELHDGEVLSTSGDYERFLSFRGRRYGHVIDPRSGVPARSARAASVLVGPGTEAGALSDAASAALFVARPGEWRAAAARMGIARVLRVEASGRLVATQAMRERLELSAAAAAAA
ncbi:MAG TPA: FAD:protein FMN transferase [Burkholderiales bacterium]